MIWQLLEGKRSDLQEDWSGGNAAAWSWFLDIRSARDYSKIGHTSGPFQKHPSSCYRRIRPPFTTVLRSLLSVGGRVDRKRLSDPNRGRGLSLNKMRTSGRARLPWYKNHFLQRQSHLKIICVFKCLAWLV